MEDDTMPVAWPNKDIMGFALYQAREDYEVNER